MFERFTDRARRVVVLAQEEARRLDHNYIGTEHLLLGLVYEGTGVAAVALTRLGIGLDAVRQQVDSIIGTGDSRPAAHIPFTPRAKKVLELSLREALQFGHNYIGTEHILLGLIREGEGVAAQALVALGADLSGVRQEVLRVLSGRPGAVEGVGVVVADPPGGRTVTRTWSYGSAEPALRSRRGDEMLVRSIDRIGMRRFTVSAARVLLLAESESMRLEHLGVGVGHLLLGLVAEGEGRAAAVLAVAGVDLGRARAAVDEAYGGVPMAPGCEDDLVEAIEWALFEALLGGLASTGAATAAPADRQPEEVSAPAETQPDDASAAAEGQPGEASGPAVGAPREASTPGGGEAEGAGRPEAQADEQAEQVDEQIDTEELLLGVLRQAERRDGVAARVLATLDVSPADLRRALEGLPSPPPPTSSADPSDQGRSASDPAGAGPGDEGSAPPGTPG